MASRNRDQNSRNSTVNYSDLDNGNSSASDEYVSWETVDPAIIYLLLKAAEISGGRCAMGRTRDGQSLAVTFYIGEYQIKRFARDSADAADVFSDVAMKIIEKNAR